MRKKERARQEERERCKTVETEESTMTLEAQSRGLTSRIFSDQPTNTVTMLSQHTIIRLEWLAL